MMTTTIPMTHQLIQSTIRYGHLINPIWSPALMHSVLAAAFCGFGIPPTWKHRKDTTNNTATGGNQTWDATNDTGQLPDATTRRDAHGMAATITGSYVHTVDRLANVVEVFDRDLQRTTYDLPLANGRGVGDGPCMARSISDYAELPPNDPAPNLPEAAPDGEYLAIAFRGPAPVSVNDSAQGTCLGVGIVELTEDGAYRRLVTVLDTRNTVDTSDVSAPGGHACVGADRSDVHGAIAVRVP